jgi:hypothetical protein
VGNEVTKEIKYMPVIALQRAIADTKIKFSLALLVLAAIITIGSFYLIGYLRFTVLKETMFAQSLQYRAEYLAQQQGIGFWQALQAASVGENISVNLASSSLGVPVLTYHSVLSDKNDAALDTTVSDFEGANVSLEHFKDQMFKLKAAGWHTVTYADFEAFVRGQKELPAKSFLLTFDDGAKKSFFPGRPHSSGARLHRSLVHIAGALARDK